MTEFVLDTSAALELTREDIEFSIPSGRMYSPSIIDVEFLNALRRLVRLNQISLDRAQARISNWIANDLRRIEYLLLLPRMWELKDNLTAYDAAFVALAEWLGVPLITADVKLARAVSEYCEVLTVS